MKTINLYQVDAFTTCKLHGNPAGVVTDTDELDEATMQAIARELNNSETAFILGPDALDHDIRIRFFTPTVEVPVCGHATIAAHYVRAVEKHLGRETIMHKVGSGIFPVEVVPENDDYTVIMTQGPPEFGARLDGKQLMHLLRALNLDISRIDTRAPIQIVSTGHSKVIVPLKTKSDLDAVQPDLGLLAMLSRDIGCNGFFLFTLDSHDASVLTHSRMFAPAIGINEDPVTGNGHGPLGAYLVKYGLINYGPTLFTFQGAQGESLHRPGQVRVEVHIADSQPVAVSVAGNAVIAFHTTLSL